MKWIALLALISVTAYAQEPVIFGYMSNKDNNRITFTNYKGKCSSGQKVVYTQSSGGKIIHFGCYILIDDQFMVAWDDGDVYTYGIDNLIFSEDFLKYLERNK